jgi:alpha-tubulin suppressor-like RCC1 family protein
MDWIGGPTPVEITGFTRPVAAVALGRYHVRGLLDSGEVACWGSDEIGQLGTGDFTDRSSPTIV